MGETFEPGSWGVDMEVNLFHAMRGHKPVGVNRHFHMIVIHEKLCNPSTKKLSANDVWNHLSTMYDLQALNESEILPFPNKPVDFKLPGEYKSFDDTDFPRMQNVGTAPVSDDSKAKPEGQAKGGKASRSEGKSSQQSKDSSKGSSSTDHKAASKAGDSKSSTPESRSSHSSKADSKSGGSSSSSKTSGKGGHSSSAHASSSATDPSPKRTKRTRASPADAPQSKRRR